MILVDTGPCVALFDPKDPDHALCRSKLEKLKGPLVTTIPVLTEAFHLLGPGSRGSAALIRFVAAEGLSLWFLDGETTARAFQLMGRYADRPMDLADASLVVAAERTGARRVFTLDRADFRVYRIRRGHRDQRFVEV